jgi:hypothetical protein
MGVALVFVVGGTMLINDGRSKNKITPTTPTSDLLRGAASSNLVHRLVVPTMAENCSFHRDPRTWFDSVVTKGKMSKLSRKSVRNWAQTTRSTWQGEFLTTTTTYLLTLDSGTLLRSPSA